MTTNLNPHNSITNLLAQLERYRAGDPACRLSFDDACNSYGIDADRLRSIAQRLGIEVAE